MAQIWLDYSGARPDPHDMKRLGVQGVVRYLSEPIPATAWKRITEAEKDAILAAGLDLVLNYEWYEGRMLEGAAAGAHDGAVAMSQAKALGYPKGASIYFSHDTSARNDSAVLAYLRAAQKAMGDYYMVDVYSGIDVVDMAITNSAATYGWQTIAWSQGRVGKAHMYQNGKQWYSGGADENVILHAGLGSWLSHAAPPAPPAGGGGGNSGGGGHPGDGGSSSASTYTVKSGDTLSGIAVRFGLSLVEIEKLNPQITNPNLIHIGDVIHLKDSSSGGGSTKPTPPKPAPSGRYVVKSGDNLTVIAQRYHTTVSELVRLNPSLKSHPNLIRVGQVLVVPGGSSNTGGDKPVSHVKQYRIVSGDNLSTIAKRYGTSVAQLVKWNPIIKNPNLIQVGWVLRVG